METYWLIVIIVGFLALCVGYLIGIHDANNVWKKAWEGSFGYRSTSPPTQQSGTHTQERGSDDTG